MRFLQILILTILVWAPEAQGATGKVFKVLPQFLDEKGRAALSPSLFERDAYQAHLRMNREKRNGIRFAVQWKTHKAVWAPLKLRVELRGTAEGNLPKEKTIEKQVDAGKYFRKWTNLDLTGQPYADFGEVTAWRVTLWEGEDLLAEQKSFLW